MYNSIYRNVFKLRSQLGTYLLAIPTESNSEYNMPLNSQMSTIPGPHIQQSHKSSSTTYSIEQSNIHPQQ